MAKGTKLTALPKRIDPRRIERDFERNDRLRSEGSAILAAAARDAGAERLIAQSIAFMYETGAPGTLHTEDDPLLLDPPPEYARSASALTTEIQATLFEELDDEQTAKARAMQRAWVAYRDTTCGFYDDKIRGSMANMMHAACDTRETARRTSSSGAMLQPLCPSALPAESAATYRFRSRRSSHRTRAPSLRCSALSACISG